MNGAPKGYLGTEGFLYDTKWDMALYICQSQRTVWCKMLSNVNYQLY